MRIGKVIRTVREALGFGQVEFSKYCGFCKNTVHYVEVGKGKPRDKTLDIIIEKLEVPESVIRLLQISEEDVIYEDRAELKVLQINILRLLRKKNKKVPSGLIK